MNVQEFKAFTRDIRKMTKLADKVEALINGANLLNSKGRLEQLVPLVRDLLVRFGKMKTQLAQYQETFTTIIAENEQLKQENCILEDERRQRNRHDMDSRTAIHQLEQKCQRYEKQLAVFRRRFLRNIPVRPASNTKWTGESYPFGTLKPR